MKGFDRLEVDGTPKIYKNDVNQRKYKNCPYSYLSKNFFRQFPPLRIFKRFVKTQQSPASF